MVLNKNNKKEIVFNKANNIYPGWFKAYHRAKTTSQDSVVVLCFCAIDYILKCVYWHGEYSEETVFLIE